MISMMTFSFQIS